MKSCWMVVVLLGSRMLVAGGPGGDRPDDVHPWAVHDENRPQARSVSTEAGAAPSDAVALFDGTQVSVDRFWRSPGAMPSETPVRWTAQDGVFVCRPDSGAAHVTNRCSNFQLHIELMIPPDAKPGEGNSGVFVGGIYELQVLHSHGGLDRPDPYPPWSDSYADGEMGAIYGQRPPLVNACRAAGRWQSYDIVFHAARWHKGVLRKSATMTVFLNGVLIHDNVELEGPTVYCRRAVHDPARECDLPVVVSLQDHGNPVRYRNIWYREIPARDMAQTPGGPVVDKAANERLRRELAEKTLALAHAATKPDARLVWLWESYAYRNDETVRAEIEAFTPECVRHVERLNPPLTSEQEKEIENLRHFARMGVRNGLFGKDCPLVRAVEAACDRKNKSGCGR